MKAKAEKEGAIYKQKIEFVEMQLGEAKKTVEESKRQHERLIKTLN